MKSANEKTQLLTSNRSNVTMDYKHMSSRKYGSLPVDEIKNNSPQKSNHNRPLTGVDSINIHHLAPFLDVADRSRLARTSTTLFNFVLNAEHNYKKKAEFKRKIIEVPQYINRNKFRLLFGHAANVLPGSLISPKDPSEPTWGCPILTANGDRFFKLQGMAGKTPTNTLPVLVFRSIFSLMRMPCSLFQCGCIVIGGIWGSYQDYRFAEKINAPVWQEHRDRTKNLRIKTAVEWADAWNPCGSEPGFNAGCSFIAPPQDEPEDSECASRCISSEGECIPCDECIPSDECGCDFDSCFATTMLIAIGIIAYGATWPYWSLQIPCRTISCLGFICGYCYGSIQDCQTYALPEPDQDQPSQQLMI